MLSNLLKSPTFGMACGAVLGALLPLNEKPPAWSLSVTLGFMIYLACFKIDLRELQLSTFRKAAVFIVARFVIFPVVLWLPASYIWPSYAPAILLITLLPAGSSSPAFTGIKGGNVALALSIMVGSSLLSIIAVPFMFATFEGRNVSVDASSLFASIISMIGIPLIIFVLTRKVKEIESMVLKYGARVSLLSVSLLIFFAFAIARDSILGAGFSNLENLVILFPLYFLYFLFGALFCTRSSASARTAFEMTSGFNNNALGASLASLYFPHLLVFFALSELPWCFGLQYRRLIASCILPESKEEVSNRSV